MNIESLPESIPLALIVFLAAFLVSAFCGLIMIPLLARLRLGQVVREEGLESHYSKNGTPTMGGLLFLFSMLIVGIPISFLGVNLWPYMLVTLGCGLVGFVDDWLKVVKRHNKGISAKQKMLSLGLISTAFVIWCLVAGTDISLLALPFLGVGNPWQIPAALAGVIGVFFLLAFTNGVNLTDGVDGLAGSAVTICLVFFGMIFSVHGNWMEARIFTALMAGGVVGYLLFNLHPAKVFMGDTGSLALGAAVASVAVASGLPLLLVIAGGVFVIEDLSVMAQVFWYKRTGKRLLLMSPIHHHFEMKGWKENRIVLVFSAVGALFGFLALIASF